MERAKLNQSGTDQALSVVIVVSMIAKTTWAISAETAIAHITF